MQRARIPEPLPREEPLTQTKTAIWDLTSAKITLFLLWLNHYIVWVCLSQQLAQLTNAGKRRKEDFLSIPDYWPLKLCLNNFQWWGVHFLLKCQLLFIHSVNGCLLSSCHVPGPVLGAGEAKMSEAQNSSFTKFPLRLVDRNRTSEQAAGTMCMDLDK